MRIFIGTGENELFGSPDQSDCLVALYRGELLEELIEGIASGEVVEEVLHWDPRAAEDGDTTHDVRRNRDDRVERGFSSDRHIWRVAQR